MLVLCKRCWLCSLDPFVLSYCLLKFASFAVSVEWSGHVCRVSMGDS